MFVLVFRRGSLKINEVLGVFGLRFFRKRCFLCSLISLWLSESLMFDFGIFVVELLL